MIFVVTVAGLVVMRQLWAAAYGAEAGPPGPGAGPAA